MKTAAIICEFNPFHNGHAHILKETKEKLGADYVIAIMSGNYVQRGEPAIFDKYTRTRMALDFADLVLELPVCFATASAHEFAAAGVSIALASGAVDFLCFGTEGNVSLENLQKYAKLIESDTFAAQLKSNLKLGLSYPEAVAKAVGSDDTLALSNNILAVEYLRALEGTSIKAVNIERLGDNYNSTVPVNETFASASALRKIILEHKASKTDIITDIRSYIPAETYEKYAAALEGPVVFPDMMSSYLNMRLLEARYHGIELTSFSDVSKEIAGRLLKTADRAMTFAERIEAVKTRQYTYTRISRALLHIALGIKADDIADKKKAGYVNYLKVLGFRRDAAELLKTIKYNASLPVITKTADHKDLLMDDIFYDQLYYALINGRSEYERSPVIV